MNYSSELRAYELKATPQRLEITAILSSAGHINIDELYFRMQKKFSQISLATIYKNINIMLQKRFIVEVKVPDSKNFYELVKEAHSHLLCLSCKEITDIKIECKSSIENSLKGHNFKIKSNSVVITGYCEKCH